MSCHIFRLQLLVARQQWAFRPTYNSKICFRLVKSKLKIWSKHGTSCEYIFLRNCRFPDVRNVNTCSTIFLDWQFRELRWHYFVKILVLKISVWRFAFSISLTAYKIWNTSFNLTLSTMSNYFNGLFQSLLFWIDLKLSVGVKGFIDEAKLYPHIPLKSDMQRKLL